MVAVKVLIGETGSGKTFYVKENNKDRKMFVVGNDRHDTGYIEYENITDIEESEVIVFEEIKNLKRDLNLIGLDRLKEKDVYLLLHNLIGNNLVSLNELEAVLNIDCILVFNEHNNEDNVNKLFEKYNRLINTQRSKFDLMTKVAKSNIPIGYNQELELK